MVVLDTHLWLLWLHSPDKLSPLARKRIEDETKTGVLLIFCYLGWEMATKVQMRRLVIPMEIYRWYNLAANYPATIIEPVSPLDTIDSTKLPGDFHKDPADRIIIAFAKRHGADLLTCDQKILAYEHVKAIW